MWQSPTSRHQAFTGSVFNPGMEYVHGSGWRREPKCGRRGRRSGRGCNPFSNHMTNLGRGLGQQIPHIGCFPGVALLGSLLPPQLGLRCERVSHSNIYKHYNNWKVCFSCGLGIEEGHSSLACPFQEGNHQMGFTWGNAQQFIMVGYNPCTKGMHKLLLLTTWNFGQCGAEILLFAHKCES